MRKWRSRTFPVLAVASALFACSGSPPHEPLPGAPGFERATMEQIAEALTHALPLSLREEQLVDPENRKVWHGALTTLAGDAARLEAHGRSREASFGYLSGSLARDANEALRRFEAGQLAESQFFVRQLVDDCVACHSRLPYPQSSALGARLLRRARLDEMDPVERARLEVATRQFDAALDTWEALFRDRSVPPGKLDLEGQVVDYLVVCIRVRGDLRRPQAPLEALAARPDVPAYLEQDLLAWVAALRKLDRMPRSGALLPEARTLLADTDEDALDRRGLVQELVASSLLHRFVTSGDAPPAELAEAYTLLGLVEIRVRHSAWLAEAEFYLETAIRTDPGSPWAERAFALLEQETRAGYSGSAGLHLPDDVRAWLDELRRLAYGS